MTIARGWHSRGYLPHLDVAEGTQSITFRLADSLPSSLLQRWREEIARLSGSDHNVILRRRIEMALDRGFGEQYLADARIAAVVEETLLHFHDDRYRLHAWCIMPTHVHVLARMLGDNTLSSVLHGWKSFSSKRANLVLGRSGRFWAPEYHDRLIRDDEHFASVMNYIKMNPVVARLCRDPGDWRFSSSWRGRRS